MKKEEIVELNGVEYTLELNRESFLAIDKVCDVDKTFAFVNKGIYKYLDNEELSEDYDPFNGLPTDDEIDKELEKKEKAMHKLVSRSFLVWLYPKYKYNIKQVEEILEPYFRDAEKAEFIGSKTGELLDKCIAIREQYNEERKNLIAQANK